MQDRTSANSMKVLLQRAAGPYIGVNLDRGGRSHNMVHVRFAPQSGHKIETRLHTDGSEELPPRGFSLECPRGMTEIGKSGAVEGLTSVRHNMLDDHEPHEKNSYGVE